MSATVSRSTTDLTAARAGLSFEPAKINKLLNEGSRDTEMRLAVSKVMESHPTFDKSKRSYMSRSQRLADGLRLTKGLIDLVDKHDWDYMSFLEGLSVMDEAVGLSLHHVAFQPVINAQGTDEQQAYWMPLCLNHAILGCYAQTELGHGSNVQQLETTATYDHATKTFDLHTPFVTSTKWWIGALGIMATHSAVQARLIIEGKDYGPHLFITQLRSLKDHSLMPGVEAGEIGPKAHGGMTSVDNGWARFTHVKLPLDRMLARFAHIDGQGKYVQPPHSKLSYGGMIFIRAQMIGNLGWSLAKATTIGTRYLHIRRQFANPELKRGDKDFGIEKQVITYPGVFMRVLPQVAKAFVFVTIGKDMAALYDSMSSQLATGDTTLLAETHAVSSGLKSYVSAATVEGVEIVRRSLGGHGFMEGTGVGRIFAKELPSTTYEGDNYILLLQVSRAALKTLKSIRANPSTALSPSSSYLGSLAAPFTPLSSAPQSWLSHSFLLHLISLRAALQVQRLERLVESGKQFSQLSHECVSVSKSIVEAYIVNRILVAIDDPEGLLRAGLGPAERDAMATLVHFYVLYTIESALPELLEFGIILPAPHNATAAQAMNSPIESLRAELNRQALKVLPDSLGLVDSFGFSDYDLDSSIGKYDGRAYETMLERAQAHDVENTGGPAARQKMYIESIKPILERGERLSKL